MAMTSLYIRQKHFLFILAAVVACNTATSAQTADSVQAPVSLPRQDKAARFADSLQKELNPDHKPEPLPAGCVLKPFSEESFVSSLSSLNMPFLKDSVVECGLALYRNFLRSHVGHRRALLGFAQLLGWAARYEESYYTYLYIDRLYPYDEEVGVGLATVLSWGMRSIRSENLLRHIGERYPNNTNVQVHLARIYAWKGNYRQAMAIAKKAIRTDTNNIYALKIIADACRWARMTGPAFKYYKKITSLSEDSTIIMDAYLQLAELDWYACRNKASIARLEALRNDPRTEKQATLRLNQEYERVGWNIGASGLRYGEYGYGIIKNTPDNSSRDTIDGYAFGLANNILSCFVKKGLNRLCAAMVEYSFGNESMESFNNVRQPKLYDVVVHEIGAGLSLDAGEAFTGSMTYTPYLYFRNDKAANMRDVNQLVNPYFHGGRFIGNAAVPGGRTYFGLAWSPQITRTLRKIVVLGKAESSLAYNVKLPGGWAVTPAVEEVVVMDTANNYKFTGGLDVLKRFERIGATLSVKATYRTFDKWLDSYFTYREWTTIKIGMEWDHLFCEGIPQKGFSMPLSCFIGGDLLTERNPPEQKFLSFSMSAKPTWNLSRGNFITLSLGGSFTTSYYATYFAGLSYDAATAKRR
jgi:tetratricopeptide (TPR) repeat protein